MSIRAQTAVGNGRNRRVAERSVDRRTTGLVLLRLLLLLLLLLLTRSVQVIHHGLEAIPLLLKLQFQLRNHLHLDASLSR